MNQLQETLDAIKDAQKTPIRNTLSKSYSVATGLTAYDLEPASKLLFPVLTPLRNQLPRVAGEGGTATNWRVITAVNPNNVVPGVSEGRRGGTISVTKQDYTATYKGIGLEDDVTFEAQFAGQGFDDVKALAVENLLKATMIAEERMILGGNSSTALGTTPTPTAIAATSATSTLPAATYSVICVALTFDGWRRASLANGVQQTISRTNADGSTDTVNAGSAMRSASVSVTTTAGQSIQASVANVSGAVAYAWYIGAAGSEALQAITTANSVECAVAPIMSRQNANAIQSDRSSDALAFDGLLYSAFKSGSGAQIINLPNGVAGLGSTLTSDNSGGVVEVEAMLAQYWDNLRISPTQMHMSARTRKVVSNRIVQNNNGTAVTPLLQIVADVKDRGNHIGATMVTKYLNKITGQEIDMMIHPDMPDGMILFYTDSAPYPLSGVGNICQIKTRREYYQIEWPLRTRRYEYGVYCDELLQHYFPPSLGILRNINVNS